MVVAMASSSFYNRIIQGQKYKQDVLVIFYLSGFVYTSTRNPLADDIVSPGKFGCSGACVGKPPPDPLGGDYHTGPWLRTRGVGEGGPAHPDDTCRGALQLKWRTGSPWLLDHCDEEAEREEQSSPTFDLQ